MATGVKFVKNAGQPIDAMIAYSDGDVRRIKHFLKAYDAPRP